MPPFKCFKKVESALSEGAHNAGLNEVEDNELNEVRENK